MSLQGPFVYYVPVRTSGLLCASIATYHLLCTSTIMHLYKGFLFIVCLYKGLLSYLFVFRSVKFCLYSPISMNYVFEPIGLPRFKRVLDSFTNCPKKTQSVLEYYKFGYMALSFSLLMNAFCKFLQLIDPLNF